MDLKDNDATKFSSQIGFQEELHYLAWLYMKDKLLYVSIQA